LRAKETQQKEEHNKEIAELRLKAASVLDFQTTYFSNMANNKRQKDMRQQMNLSLLKDFKSSYNYIQSVSHFHSPKKLSPLNAASKLVPSIVNQSTTSQEFKFKYSALSTS
jgi:hypothetical protein